MAGLIRWRNLQNIQTTEAEINKLAGLLAVAEDLNRIIGFTGTGTQLNDAVQIASELQTHKQTSLADAHPLQSNSLDGNVIGIETLPLNRINNYANILTQADIDDFSTDVDIIQQDLQTAQNEIQNLYSLITGIEDNGLPQVIDNLISHIEKTEDAHDASAISLGNYYYLASSTTSNATQLIISTDDIRWFKEGDEISITDDISVYYDRTVTGVNYNTGHISFTPSIVDPLTVSHNAIIFNRSQGNAQEGIDRSLRNTTDVFTGRLTINQNSDNNAIEINKTGLGYTAKFNDFVSKTLNSFEVELGKNDGTSHFILDNSDKRVAFSVTDDGVTHLNRILFEDRDSYFLGEMDHQPLTFTRSWMLPDRSGYIGLGDLTFQELLKVSLIEGTKEFQIAPGFMQNYDGEIVYAWTTMEEPSKFPGGTVDIEAQMIADNTLIDIGSSWQVINMYITDQDDIGFMYGPLESVRQDAIDNFHNIVPSAYMKLAQFIIKGDGVGGIDQSSIEILSDQRPIFTMGVSSAFYDETTDFIGGLSAGVLVTLPRNYRAGGIRQTYKPGKGQLEVYLDGVYQKVNLDYIEVVGEPEGQIRFLKDLKPESQVRFRITYTSAAAGGGIQAATLQSAYESGPTINASDIYGPITIDSFDLDIPFIVDKSIIVNGSIYDTKALELVPQTSEPGETDISKIYLDQYQDLILKRYLPSGSTYFNITKEIINSQESTSRVFINNTGAPIPKGAPVSLHPSLTGQIVLTNTSTEGPLARCIGLAGEVIPNGQPGRVILNGILSGISGFAQASVLVVDPTNPGVLINKNLYAETPTSAYVEVGTVNGSQIIVDIDRNKKEKKNIITKVAGESFQANVPKIVRLAKGTETANAVYVASKELANANQNFWAYGIVCPSSNVAAGELIKVYLEDEPLSIPVSSGIAFSNSEIGLPFYMGIDGNPKAFNAIAYNSGDAIIKVGMISAARTILLKSPQIMGTQP